MPHGFWQIAAEQPSQIAIVDTDGSARTFGELLAAANQLVHGLRAQGMQRGDVLAVAMRNRAAVLELYMAALQAGWYFAPLHTGLAAREIEHVLTDSRARVLVIDANAAEAGLAAAQRCGAELFSCDDVARPLRDLVANQPTMAPDDRVAGDRLFYTSGTTGVPKAVRRRIRGESPERAAEAAAAHLGAVAGIAPQSGAIHLVTSPLYHSASLLWCVDHLHLGHTVVLMDRWAPEAMLETIAQHRVTSTLAVPTHFYRLLALPDDVRARYDVSSLRHVIHTGAACPVALKRRMLDWWGPVLIEVYGAAEGGGTRISSQEWLEHPGSVGKGHGRIRVLREDGEPCQPGEIGLVYMKAGPAPFEYHNDPAKTAAARRGTFFTVGDLGYLDSDDYLFLCGRASELVISGGVNIYPAEIEAVLASHRQVADVAVIGVPDEEWGERVVAVVQPVAGSGPELVDTLRAYCKSQLAAHKCPRAYELVAALPRDENGKLRKRELQRSSPRDGIE